MTARNSAQANWWHREDEPSMQPEDWLLLASEVAHLHQLGYRSAPQVSICPRAACWAAAWLLYKQRHRFSTKVLPDPFYFYGSDQEQGRTRTGQVYFPWVLSHSLFSAQQSHKLDMIPLDSNSCQGLSLKYLPSFSSTTPTSAVHLVACSIGMLPLMRKLFLLFLSTRFLAAPPDSCSSLNWKGQCLPMLSTRFVIISLSEWRIPAYLVTFFFSSYFTPMVIPVTHFF